MSRHMNTGRKLSRNSSHRKALLQNLVRALFLSESIKTTTPKAKEARRVAERLITRARIGTVAARREVHRTVRDQAALAKLFDNIAPRFKTRPGGYTRIIHLPNRVGDNAPMSILELVEKATKDAPVDTETDAKAEKKAKAPKAPKAPKAEAGAEGDAPKAEKKPKAKKAKKDEGEKKAE